MIEEKAVIETWTRWLKEAMLKLIRICLLLLTFISLTSCYSPGSYMGPTDIQIPLKVNGRYVYPKFTEITPDLALLHESSPEYRIGIQDILTIIVWNHPELTIPSMQTTSENVNIYTQMNQQNNNPAGILVDKGGKIFFPLAGKISVAGLTVDKIRQRITKRLVRFIRNPQVSVRVSAFRSKPVYLLGEVVKPGTQYITDMPMTLMDILNNANGVDRETSDPHYIYVIRGHYQKPEVYWLNMTSPFAVLMAEHFQLQSKDIVIVSTSGVVRYSRMVNRIIPTIQTFTSPVITSQDYFK